QSDTPSVKDVVEKTASLKIDGAVNSKPVSVAAKSSKVSKVPAKEKMASTASSSHSFADPENFIEEILEKASAIVLSEIKEENFKQHGDQLGTVVSNSMKTNLSLELKRLAYRRILIVWLNTLKYRTVNSCRESTLDIDAVEYQPFQ
ncbi:prolyl-tRNA synthetase associated domain-containing protein 1, partial [Tanacetum coccineum]